jgi:hypothetical protein
MQTVTTVGLDIAKSVFQVHGVDAAGQVAIRRQLKRRHVLAFFQKLPPCLIGIEADTRGGTPTQDSPNSLRERRYEAAPVFGREPVPSWRKRREMPSPRRSDTADHFQCAVAARFCSRSDEIPRNGGSAPGWIASARLSRKAAPVRR